MRYFTVFFSTWRPLGRLLALAATLLAVPAVAQTTQTFNVAEDSYVQASTSSNYGGDAGIQIKKSASAASTLRNGFVKFNVTLSAAGTIGTATLKLYCYQITVASATATRQVTAYSTADNWLEGTIAGANAPALGTAQGAGTVAASSYTSIDVTSYVQSKFPAGATTATISMAITDAISSANLYYFASKENTANPNPPTLEISTAVAPPVTVLTGTYYVDATNGLDTNTGLSQASPWKTSAKVSTQTFGPGAQILFKAGQRFSGTLSPSGSGAVGQPIVIDQYGTGAKPALDGNGASYTLWLNNQQYWEVKNLEITNYNATEEGGLPLVQWEANNVSQWANATQIQPQYAVVRTKKFGILVTAQDQGPVKYLHFVNINMHGINGFIDNDVDDSKFNGGMFFDIGGTSVPTYFDDLLVQGCRIADIDRTGVSNRSTWTNRTLTTIVNWTPTLNYVLRNNVFERTGAQGLIVRDSKNPLIENNLFDHCSIKTSGNACFNFDCDGALWQFNESRFTKANINDTDAGGIDSDYRSINTIMQYNYLHDNDYGLLITGGPGSYNDNTVFRYNVLERNGLVSQNVSDGKYQIKVSGSATNTTIHNNIIYLDSTQANTKPTLHKQWTDFPDQTSYYNNVFYVLGQSPTFDLGGSTNNLFSNNLYYGTAINNKPVDAYAVNANPDMMSPGTGPNGYKLQAGSAAIAKGQLIPTLPALDFFQAPINKANAIDIGIQQFSSRPPTTSQPVLIPQQVFGLEDAYVEGGASSTSNFGSATVLRVKNNPASAAATRQSYLKYNLSGVTNAANVVSVQLVVNTTVNPTGTMPLSVFAVNDDTWHENTITDANQPGRNAYVTTLTASGNATNAKQFSVDITSYALSQLNGDKVLSLVLADTTGSNVLANVVSKEGAASLQHYLLVTTRGTLSPPDVPASKFDIYLLIGQSNMAGRGNIGVPDLDTLKNVRVFTGTSWEKAANPLNKYSTVRKSLAEQQLGPGYTFGRKLAAITGQTIGLVVNARGGSSLSQWQKGYNGSDDFNLYEEAVGQIRKVMAQGNFKGILWHQGESDQSASSAYLARFQQLVSDLRQDLGVPVPVIVGELGKWRTSSANLNAVLRSIPANVPNSYYVTSDGLTPLNGDLTEPHFDGPSQRILGERYADKVAAAIYNEMPGTVWNGSLSTDWSAATNWSPPVVPTDTANVTIAKGAPRYPLVGQPGSLAARSLTLKTGGSLGMSDGTLTVASDWTNNGTFTATGGTVAFGGSTAGPANVLGRSPSAFWNLTVAAEGLRQGTATAPAADSGGVSVQRLLTLRGNLAIQNNPFTLQSNANGTAMVANLGGALLGTATVQRYLDPSLNAGPGYRHLSAPVAGSPVASLATTGFTPVVNPAYNTSATPSTVMPFPTVLGYDQSRIATVTSNYSAFDKGWFSPTALTSVLTPGQGYSVNMPAAGTVNFRGTATTGDLTQNLARGSNAEAGWQLVGNPYPAPLAYNRLAPADRTGLDAAIYVFESTGPYTGSYRSYVNGLGGDSLLASGQAFFVRVSPGQTSGTLRFRNAQRRTQYTNGVMRRGTADTRPQIQLTLTGAGMADQLFVYAEAGATVAADTEFDAIKLPNATGLNLATLTANGESLAIDGRPAFTSATVIPLTVSVPAAGLYTFTAANVANLPTGITAYLRDALLGTCTAVTVGTTVSFTLAGTTAAGRFFLETAAAGPLSTASSAKNALVTVFPNPAHGRFTVLRPTGAATTATLLNSLGQVVRTLPLPSAETAVDVAGLASGVYTLRLTLDGQPVAKRIVLE